MATRPAVSRGQRSSTDAWIDTLMWAALTLTLTVIAVILVALVWRRREFRARRTWVDEESRRSAEAWRRDDAEPLDEGSAAESGST